MRSLRRIGILTGGGDCPGLNAVVRAVTKSALFEYGLEVTGVLDGFAGLLENRSRVLESGDVSSILSRGGTILGASNRDNPFKVLTTQGAYQDRSDLAASNIRAMGIDTLICVGGDGTMAIAHGLHAKGVPLIGVPKTIDNDLKGTDQTFGFDSAVSIVADALDRLHFTAASHHRILVVETMGRYAGWLALQGGLAGGADVILIPEIPYRLSSLIEAFERRRKSGRTFSIVAVAEGARPEGGAVTVAENDPKRTDPRRLGGVAARVAGEIEAAGGRETRVVVLGHLQRGGSPTAFDRILGTRYGIEAVDLATRGETGRMVSLRQGRITSVPLEDAVGSQRLIEADDPLVRAAKIVGTCLGD